MKYVASFCSPKLRNLILLCLVILSQFAAAQTPISPIAWTGSPASAAGASAFTTVPATVVPGAALVAVSQWDRGAVVFNAAAGCYNSRDWQVGGSLAAAQAANRCIFFTITNSGTTQLRITRLFIRSQVSATGPQSVQVMYTLGATTAPFGTTVATAHTATPEDWTLNGDVCAGPGQTITFRLYGWGATGAAGTLRINDGTSVNAEFAAPVTATASSNAPVCAGTDLYLTGAAAGGIPGYTYSWAGPDGFTAAILSPTVTAVPVTGAGVYTLTVTDAMNCSTTSTPVTTTVTVNTSPAPITGALSVCPLLTTTLSSTSVGGTWSSSNTSIATVTAAGGVVTGVASGTATITYQLSTSCFTTATFTVNTPPDAITGGLSLCNGFTSVLTSGPGAGTWASGNIGVATVTGTGTVTGVAVGTADVTFTAATGCIATAIVTVQPFPSGITGTATVCEGATTPLSNATPGGTWSSGNTAIGTVGAGGVVGGISAGTAVISYSLPGGCFVSTVVTVQPIPASIGGTLAVCQGSTTGLSNLSAGGTWASSNTAIFTIGSASGIVTGVAAGTATVTYRFTSTGCYRTATVTVHPLPAAITGPTGVCIGATVTLSSTTAGGNWFSSNTAIGTVDATTGIVTGITSGTTNISYILPVTGCFVTRVQTVYPLPSSITGPSVVCPAQSITLSSSPTTGAWSSGNITRATVVAATGVVTGVSAGTVDITYTLPTGCIATRNITVNVAPPATITPLGDTTFCPGGFVALVANSGAGLTYQWFLGTSPVLGATGTVITATTPGSYSVRVTNTLGCPWRSIPMTVTIDAVTAGISVPGGTTTSCSASPVLLNASPTTPGHSYQWLRDGLPLSGASGSSVAASVSGFYAVAVTNATGCADTSAAVYITIIPSPDSAITVSGSLTICNGSSVTLHAAMGTGYTYQWYQGTSVLTGATSSAYIATAAGTYSVLVTNADGCSVNSGTRTVIVNPLPPVDITPGGPMTVCAGGTVSLSAAAGAYTYQWYRNGAAIPGATNMAYIATATGGYRVRVFNTATGCSALTGADSAVNILPLMTAMSLTPSSFCWGGNATLSTNVSYMGSALLYRWYRNGVAIPGATMPTYAAGTTGIYKCDIVVPGSCLATTNDVSVSDMPLPNPIISQGGGMLYTGAFYTSYQWYKDNLPVAGATTYRTAHTGPGNYKVRVVDTNGCQSTSDRYAVTGGTTAVGVHAASELQVYPNPTTGVVNVAGGAGLQYHVTSADGRTLMRGVLSKFIDVSHLPSSLYLLYLYDNNGNLLQVHKLIKE